MDVTGSKSIRISDFIKNEDFNGITYFRQQRKGFLESHDQELLTLERKDKRSRVFLRKITFWAFLVLVFLQTAFVFKLVWEAFWRDQLQGLSLILGTLLTGTLIETYLVMKEMMKWIFSENNYHLRHYRDSEKNEGFQKNS